ncbi:hypothetical protein [Saccharopolyspora pogona]|nr:hypothetical protein [Saccharopolyspora pogona]
MLCGQLRPRAVDRVTAFGRPRQWLTAPIATGAEARRQEAQHAHETA